jgi:hypothetical protein
MVEPCRRNRKWSPGSLLARYQSQTGIRWSHALIHGILMTRICGFKPVGPRRRENDAISKSHPKPVVRKEPTPLLAGNDGCYLFLAWFHPEERLISSAAARIGNRPQTK